MLEEFPEIVSGGGAAARTSKLDPLMRLWILRLLVCLNHHRQFVRRVDFLNDDIAIALGFGRMVGFDSDCFDRRAVMADLRAQYARAEATHSTARAPGVLSRNIKRLAKMLALAPEECRVLEFAVLLHNEEILDNACDLLGHAVTTKQVARTLGRLLDLPASRVAEVLSPQGLLSRSGLLTTNRHGGSTLRGKLDLLSESFADRMVASDTQPVDLLRGRISLAPPAQLSLSDYGHLSSSLELLQPYLRFALSEGRPGVNILLHGPPGTGKTQLARRLARELHCDLFEVASEDEDGDPVDGERRLRAYRAAQTLLVKGRALILFDEVEDVFNDGSELFGRKSTAQTRKAWMNRMLEETPVATFWLSNSITGVDPAFVRRFDMVIEMPIPPRAQRQRIVERVCGDLVTAQCAARIAESDSLAPALVSRAASVVRALGTTLGAARADQALEHLVSSTLQAQGHRRLTRHDPTRLPDIYDVSFLNADSDIHAIARGLKAAKAGRLCLYGPPGTGKTAFARWLARELELPLQSKRASDLLSPYVGMTEKHIATAFREAEQEGALLLIDEVDSFLRGRGDAQRSWEATQVNEMLTQMEAFPGIFVASTNLMNELDPAALRRFDAKICMGYLHPDQMVAMLRAHCRELGLGTPHPHDEAALLRLGNLAVGDFATLMRQNRFSPIASVGQVVELLGAEVALRGAVKRPIGFVH